MGREGFAHPPGSSLGFHVCCTNQWGLSLDQELFLCLWQPSQSRMLTDGHNMQQPRPPRTVSLFPACKNNKQLPGQQQPSVLHLSPWRLLLCLSLRLDHVAGGWVQEGLGHFVVSPHGSFQLPHLQNRPSRVQLTLANLSKVVGRGWMDKQTDSCYGPISSIAWDTRLGKQIQGILFIVLVFTPSTEQSFRDGKTHPTRVVQNTSTWPQVILREAIPVLD